MKFFLTFAAVITVAVAGPTQRAFVTPGSAGPAPVIMPDFGPAPVIVPEPIAIGPALIDSFEPVAIGPALIDFPVPESSPAASANTPLVQIILNINKAATEVSPIAVAPVAVPEPIDFPAFPVEVVDFPAVSPVQVVDFPPVSPVQIVDIVPPTPVQVVETAPIAVEPVIIGKPVFPSPAVVLPEELN